jgi:glycosyltransferase involved in cell wall biosynthesis
VYNGADFLREQVRSILEQSCRDFELLIHDDASTDNSAEMLAALATCDRRIKLTVASHNCGQKVGLRVLLTQARGRFVMFSDQDDVWHPRKIEFLLSAIGDTALCYGDSQLIDGHGDALAKSISDYNGPTVDGRDNTDFLFRSVVSGHALLARREVVDPAVFLLGTEYDWLLAVLATFSGGVVYAPESITYHRQHEGNQVNSFSAKKREGGPQSKHWHRVMRLHDALVVLRSSVTVDPEKRQIFNRLFKSLRDDLMLARPSVVSNRQFARRFDEALRQLVVGEPECRRARKAVDKICRGILHPKSIRDALLGR